jgi:hypothetical protein
MNKLMVQPYSLGYYAQINTTQLLMTPLKNVVLGNGRTAHDAIRECVDNQVDLQIFIEIDVILA